MLDVFGRVGAGASYARTGLDAIEPETPFADRDPAFQDTTSNTEKIKQHFWRPCAWVGGGLSLSPWRHFGFPIELRNTFAPAIENLLGESHTTSAGSPSSPECAFGVGSRTMRKPFDLALRLCLFAGCSGRELIANPLVQRWCGDGPCDWQADGEIMRVGTWHPSDYAVELVSDDAKLSQLNANVDQAQSTCFSFSAL